MKLLNLIRYKNLIFIILIQCLITYALINPLIMQYGLLPLTPAWMVWLVILSTVIIAAAGYVINDYFDLKIDRINKPDKVLIGDVISKDFAVRMYQILTVIGIALGLIVAVVLKSFTIGFIYILVPGLLWFYSASYKRQMFVGNLMIALMSGLVILLPLLVEETVLSTYYGELLRMTPISKTLFSWVCGFAGFAFLWTLIREIIKDAQDIAGDSEMECRTIPIVWGETVSKIIVSCLVVLAIGLLYLAVSRWMIFPSELGFSITIRYVVFGIALPSVCLLVLLWSNSCKAYRNASGMVKFIMLVGILYTLVFYYIYAQAYGFTMFGLFKVV